MMPRLHICQCHNKEDKTTGYIFCDGIPYFPKVLVGCRRYSTCLGLVFDERMLLEEIATHTTVTIIWIPGYRAIKGMHKANALTKAGTTKISNEFLQEIGVPLPRDKQMGTQKLHSLAKI